MVYLMTLRIVTWQIIDVWICIAPTPETHSNIDPYKETSCICTLYTCSCKIETQQSEWYT